MGWFQRDPTVLIEHDFVNGLSYDMKKNFSGLSQDVEGFKFYLKGEVTDTVVSVSQFELNF